MHDVSHFLLLVGLGVSARADNKDFGLVTVQQEGVPEA